MAQGAACRRPWNDEQRSSTGGRRIGQPPSSGQRIAANEPIYDHAFRVVFGNDMGIREVHDTMRSFPYNGCPQGNDGVEAMVGARIGRG